MRKSIIAVTAISILMLAAGAGAASRYLITNVHQIKPSVLGQLHGQNGHSGAQGPAGASGAPGAPGAPGAFSTANVTTVVGQTAFMTSGGVASSLAQCPAGSVVLGGGLDGGSTPPVVATIGYDKPVGGSAWEIIVADDGSGLTSTITAVATCATGSGAHIAHSSSSGVQAAYQADIKRAQAAANHGAF